MPLKVESDGRMFPKANTSEAVIDLFLSEAKRLNVEIRLKSSVKSLEHRRESLQLETDGERFEAESVLVATGSQRGMWQILKGLGFRMIDPVPSLFSFNLDPSGFSPDLSGTSLAHVAVELGVGRKSLAAEGPLLFTHWGMSGPAILRLSAWAARELSGAEYRANLIVRYLPREVSTQFIESMRATQASKVIGKTPPPGLTSKLWNFLCSKASAPGSGVGIASRRWGELSKKEISNLMLCLSASDYQVVGKTTNKEEFVTAGGVDSTEIDFRSMSAKRVPNLYFAGEVLNIDGITGGFNFQSAWSTSTVAARHAARRTQDASRRETDSLSTAGFSRSKNRSNAGRTRKIHERVMPRPRLSKNPMLAIPR